MPDPNPSWRLHETPNPAERSISLIVPMTEINERKADFDAYPEFSLFRDFPLIPEPSLAQDDQYGPYLFTSCAEASAVALEFFFAQNKTDIEAKTPYRSLWKRFGNHRHPPVLEALAFLEDNAFPLVTNVIRGEQSGMASGPKSYVREIFINEVNEGSRFLMDQGISPRPIRIARFPVPQPGYISYSINGVNGSIPESLHDDMEIPSTQTANVTLIGGNASAVISRLPGQFFPRTNFKRRRPYVLTVQQDLINGVWYWERLRVFPPKSPKTTVQ